MSTTGDTDKVHIATIDDFGDEAWVWLTWTFDNPGNPCYANWVLKGQWGSSGSVKTGPGAYIEGFVSGSGVFGHAQNHAVHTGELVVLYDKYPYPWNAPTEYRRIVGCFYIQSEDPEANSYSQTVLYYLERERQDISGTGNWTTVNQWDPKSVTFKVTKI